MDTRRVLRGLSTVDELRVLFGLRLEGVLTIALLLNVCKAGFVHLLDI